MIGQRLEVRQGQGLVITPQLQQAIKLLQLSNLELEAFVEGELERNPLLQRDEPEGDGAEAVETAPAASADAEMTFGDGVGGEAASALDAGSDDVYGDAAPGERTSDRMTDEAQPGLSDWSSAGKGGGVTVAMGSPTSSRASGICSRPSCTQLPAAMSRKAWPMTTL